MVIHGICCRSALDAELKTTPTTMNIAAITVHLLASGPTFQ
jgi:hypothetical protein